MAGEWKTRWQERVKVGLGCGGCLLVPILPLYMAFVVQNLWNWFLSDALHAATISYWQSVGIVILFYILTHKPDTTYRVEQRMVRSFTMLQALLPEEKLATFTETFKKEDESWTAAFANITPAGEIVITNTVAPAVGFAVHTFLM